MNLSPPWGSPWMLGSLTLLIMGILLLVYSIFFMP